MSERIHVLAQQLFGKSSVDECDLQEVKDLADLEVDETKRASDRTLRGLMAAWQAPRV